MTLISLLKKEESIPHRLIVAMALVSGLANVGILALINTAAGTSPQDDASVRLMLLFLVAMAIFNVSQRYVFNNTAVLFETIVDKLRVRILDKIRGTNLIALESLGHAEIYTKLIQNSTIISQAAGMMAAAIQSALMVIFSVLYIASLSVLAFVVTVGVIVAGCLLYLRNEKKIIGYIVEANRTEVQFLSSVTNVLRGFKEIKLNVRKGKAVTQKAIDLSSETRDLKIKASQMYSSNYVFAQNFFYILIAIVIFLLPQLAPTAVGSVTEVAATILFIIGPLSTIVSGVPAYTNANIAVQEIYQLEADLDNARRDEILDNVVEPIVEEFEQLRVTGLEFSYHDLAGNRLFGVGPIDFELNRGEVVFIVGGNGSGKSTFVKTLLGLYILERGRIEVNGERVTPENVQSYRELFSTILSDFHLFDRLYGLARPEDGVMASYLKQMGLQTKTAYVEDVFTTLELSTGQRKRLALIVALLEDRPIYVFDEWAAEQDPEFRHYFYEELLMEMKARGKSVIAISHDDRYFDRADRIIKLEYGQAVPF